MDLKLLYLHNFRNYKEGYFEFSPGINLICGPNARGKTSVLEAIYYLMLGRSFRTPQQQDLIKQEESVFSVDLLFNKYTIDQKLKISGNSKERKIVHNQTVLPSVSHLLGLIQGIIMTPDDVNLIKGPAHLRRQFIDLFIAQFDPLYIHHFTRYHRAIKQRNQLLKLKKTVSIESWEHEMAHAAAYLTKQRKDTIQELLVPCQDFYTYLTEEKEELHFLYRANSNDVEDETSIKNSFLKQFEKQRAREMLLGYTVVGPHKDDISMNIGKQEARFFASEGQQRSLVTALYIGAWKYLKQRLDTLPLFMIDDIGMGLDESRRCKLIEQLENLGQVFLTSTNCNLIKKTKKDHKVFEL